MGPREERAGGLDAGKELVGLRVGHWSLGPDCSLRRDAVEPQVQEGSSRADLATSSLGRS